MFAQKPLPKLPIPSLEQTMQMYLKFLLPISTPEQHECVRKLVQSFQAEKGEGAQLQNMLQAEAASKENWVGIL